MIREVDENSYNEGGLGRCSTDSAATRIKNKSDEYLHDPECRHFAAAERLQVLLSGLSYDIYSKDVYYHQSCYISYVHAYARKSSEIGDMELEVKKNTLDAFFAKLKSKY